MTKKSKVLINKKKSKMGPHEVPIDWDGFIECLRKNVTIDKTCSVFGVSEPTVWKKRRSDPEFAKVFDLARGEGLEEHLHSVAVGGKDVKSHAVTAGIFLLKGAKPEKYAERVHATVQQETVIVVAGSADMAILEANKSKGSLNAPPLSLNSIAQEATFEEVEDDGNKKKRGE